MSSINDLDSKRQALLKLLLDERNLQPRENKILKVDRSKKFFPLSWSQERLWFFEQLNPNTATYNSNFSLRFKGELDLNKLEIALNRLVERHESLRTVFSYENEEIYQSISNYRFKKLPVRSLSTSENLIDAINLDASKTFDLNSGELFRPIIYKINNKNYILSVTLHHIISDGWSNEILLKELNDLYNSEVSNKESSLSNLDIQYLDYASWQKEWLNDEDYSKQLDYWKNKLSGAPPNIQLNYDFVRPSTATYEGGFEEFSLDESEFKKISNLAKKKNVSIFTVLYTLFNVFLFRYTGQNDIVVGIPSANRDREELDKIVGFFANTLAIRTFVPGEYSVNELIKSVHESVIEGMENQNIPFEKLVEELNPNRTLNMNPFFQVMMVYENVSNLKLNFSKVEVTPLTVDTGTEKFDLTLHALESDGSLKCMMRYNSNLFKRSSINRLVNHFNILIKSAIEHPEIPINRLNLNENLEQNNDLCKNEKITEKFIPHSSIHQMFEKQAELNPDAIAVTCENKSITYEELNNRANILAFRLKSHGIGSNQLVGISMSRSIDLIVGILGILKAGGAYVPLDPNYPEERIDFMIKDSNIRLVVTQKDIHTTIKTSEVNQIYIEDSEFDNKVFSNINDSKFDIKNLAYVIYTSGSTGQPKGVLIDHSNVLRLFSQTEQWYKFNSNEVWTLFHSYSFDVSVFEMWGALLYGGKLVIVPSNTSKDPHKFYELLVSEKVTVLSQTPTAFRQLIQVDKKRSSSGDLKLKYVIFAGEALEIEMLKTWMEKHGDSSPKLINMYGTTETTVHATYREIKYEDLKQGRGNLVGIPIPDLNIYVLDQFQQQVPIGVPGEIYIGGSGVSKGYLNRKDLTSEKFIINPFRPGDILYKTGDLARKTEFQELEYLGRIDHQVKIRGFRIELGEIEHILSCHPSIGHVIVLVKENDKDDKRIMAYVVRDQHVTKEELHLFLKKRLPEYMVPAHIIFIDEIPLTANGKLDRENLLSLNTEVVDINDGMIVYPSTDMELGLHEIFCDLLKIKQLSVTDNFFEMGGHSLLATKVISRLRQKFDVNLPLINFFENPTIKQLAQEINDYKLNNRRDSSNTLNSLELEKHIPVSYAQKRLYFIEKLNRGKDVKNSYNLPVSLSIKGNLNFSALEYALNCSQKRFESLRTNFKEVDGKPQQIINDFKFNNLILVNLSDKLPEDKGKVLNDLLLKEYDRVFELEKDSLFKYYLVRLSDEEHVLITNTHHLITDGWSMDILFKDLSFHYNSFIKGEFNNFEIPKIQYADFTQWQQNWINNNGGNDQLIYWKEQLGGNIPVLQLPTDQPKVLNLNQSGVINLNLSEELINELKIISRENNSTLFMIFLSLFKLLLSRLSKQEDILIGVPIANRNYENVEEIVGLFVNTLVFRTNINFEQTFLELLSEVRNISLNAFSNQDIPFEKVVEELQPDRSMNLNPFFDILFNYHNHNNDLNHFDFKGIKVEEIKLDHSNSKFSLTLHVYENENDISLRVVYKKDLFSEKRMELFMSQFNSLLNQVVKNPNKQISHYSLRTEIMDKYLPTPNVEFEYSQKPTVFEMVKDIADLYPSKIAILDGELERTYDDLINSANYITKALLNKELKKGEVVGIIGNKSFGLYASLLGVFNSGGVALLIDKDQIPKERQDRMIEKADVKYTIYIDDEQDIYSEVNLARNQNELFINSSHIYTCNEDISLFKVTSEDPAYITFTSGSTGEPKGILGRHIGLSHCLQWLHQEFHEINCKDRFSQLIHLSFDYVFRDIFLPLTVGATLCIPKKNIDFKLDQIVDWLKFNKISIVQTVPSIGNLWINNISNVETEFPYLKLTFFGGEPLNDSLVKKWRAKFSGEIVNAYGPSETTLAVCFARVSKRETNGIQSVGTPIDDVQVFIVNEHNTLCGIGEVGEIVIRSPYRSLGYINDSVENEKFVEMPWSLVKNSNDVVYFTGDIGRYGLDGDVNVLGRRDDQVKIRGVRIELNEVKSILMQIPEIQDCVIIKHENEKKEPYLVAYYVSNHDVDSSQLRSEMKKHLQSTMIPKYFVSLKQLPLLKNGKVDKNTLLSSKVKFIKTDEIKTKIEARDSLEFSIKEIWKETLNIKSISIDDDFFEIGGDSFKAMEVTYKIKEELNIDLPLYTFINSPTISEVCQSIKNMNPNALDNNIVKLRSGNDAESPLFLIHPFGGGVMCYLPLINELALDQPIYGLYSKGYENEAPAFNEIEKMANYYLTQILSIQEEGPFRLAAWSFGVLILFEIVYQLEKMGKTIDYVGFFDYLPLENNQIGNDDTSIRYVSKLLLNNAGLDESIIEGMQDDKALEIVRNHIINEISKSQEGSIESMDRAIKVMIGNSIAREKYSRTKKIKSDVYLYKVNETSEERPMKIIQAYDATKITSGKIYTVDVPGNHHTMCSYPHVKTLADKINNSIPKM